jgi:hypothetical protein
LRKRLGSSLVEVMIALCVLGMTAPVALDALGAAFVAGLRVQENADMASSAEWWFNRLPYPVAQAGIDASPAFSEDGGTRFEWETEGLDNGAIRVTLRVYGPMSKAPFTMSRIY